MSLAVFIDILVFVSIMVLVFINKNFSFFCWFAIYV